MSTVVIDTNVLLIANESHDDESAYVSPECVGACAEALLNITTSESSNVAVDDGWRVIGEYQNKTDSSHQKKTGDVFIKWLLQNPKRCVQVHINETKTDEFDEFPDLTLQAKFDPPDRKFVAVAHAHPDKPPILQAADCKWLDWWPALKASGIEVKFLCPCDVQKFYQRKFPNKPLPDFP